MSSLKKQALSGVVWTFAQQFSVQAINFGVQIILARLLMPEDFGLIAMLTVFISIGQFLMDGGMATSLIRTKNPDQIDYSTVFMTNMLMSIMVYLLVYITAPFIGRFYEQDLLSDILRVYALTFVIRSFVAVHAAKLTKEMNFKTQMKLQVPSTIVGAIVGVSMAYMGFGVWSLVWLNLAQTIVFTVQNWVFIKWRPSLIFNKRRFKYHFGFGYKMTLSGLLDTIYKNAYRIVIGKFFSPASVGFYNQAETMRLFPVRQLEGVLGKVTYPMFSNIKDDKQLKSAYKQTMKLVFFVVVPIMMILIVTGKEFFLFLFGEKWLPAVPYFQILAFASITTPFTTYNLNILKVKGRSDLFLKLEIIKKVIGFLAIAISLSYGIMTLIISQVIVTHIFAYLNMHFSGRLISYSAKEQIKDCAIIYGTGVLVLILTYLLKSFLEKYDLQNAVVLLALSLFFIIVYLIILFLLERKTLSSLKSLLRR